MSDRIEVGCPTCSERFLVDASAAGGEFVCLACATPVRIPQARSTAAAPPVRPAVPEPRARDGVICPRCRLHFAPEQGLSPAEGDFRPRVLIVEDLGYFRKIAEHALAADYDLETVASVEEAKAVLGRDRIDLIVLDLSLEGRDDGISLLRDSVSKSCPVLIFTARDESEMYGSEWEELRRLGADDVLIKGMNVAESLQRKVGALLGRPWRDEDGRGD